MRFSAVKRTALDGKKWWCVFDNKEYKFSTYTCFGKYKKKSDCENAILIYKKEWELGQSLTTSLFYWLNYQQGIFYGNNFKRENDGRPI